MSIIKLDQMRSDRVTNTRTVVLQPALAVAILPDRPFPHFVLSFPMTYDLF